MPASEDFSFSAQEFSGIARLFPLPNLVLFPHVMQPLHIFEPRYRELFREALAGDRLIAMALLAPGWEADYEGRPPLYPVACLGRIAAHHRLADGSYNVLLSGLKRVEIVRELPAAKAFREAKVVVRDDFYPDVQAEIACQLRRKFEAAFHKVVPTLLSSHEQMDSLVLETGVSLGVLTDIISYMLDIPLADKEALLAERDVHLRAEALLEHLTRAAADASPGAAGAMDFPPVFSEN